jgi:hypothetical protein
MQKAKGVEGFMGAIQQFGTQNLNRLVVNKKTRTKIDYFFIKSRVLARQRRILWGYRYRSMKRGRRGLIMNTEELASLWHFPVLEVKAPSVQKVEAKKAQPPSGLPIEQAPLTPRPTEVISKGPPPKNIPTI